MALKFYLSSFLGLIAIRGAVFAQSTNTALTPILADLCCGTLSVLFSSQVSYPGSASYQNQENGTDGYWTAQESALQPTCRFTPTCAEDVSLAVKIMAVEGCQFAIRSGGHMAWAGAANIAEGVTIDLSALNSVVVNEAQTITSIGVGARWEQVYLALDAMGLATSGGRVAPVGVGGLTTGGGISFFVPRYGFVCDNVVSFEVVTAQGDILTASATENEDLWLALKGGNNNFGVVTNVNMKTFKQGKIWGGEVVYPGTTAPAQFESLYWFGEHSGSGEDNYTTIINAYVFIGAENSTIIANSYENTAAVANPAILSNFTSIQPVYEDTTRITNLTDLAIELNGGTPDGLRQLFASTTFANNATMFAAAYNACTTAFAAFHGVSDFQTSFVLEPITIATLEASAAAGGNSLGLSPSDGNLVILDLTVQWSDPTVDADINAAAESMVAQVDAIAKEWGLFNEFVYLNYALPSQDPISSYGPDNLAALRATAKKYDPQGVFQSQVPGGFKLYR